MVMSVQTETEQTVSWKRGQDCDLLLTFTSHSTLKDKKSVSGLTSVLDCPFSRELMIMSISVCSSLQSLDFLQLDKGRQEQDLLFPGGKNPTVHLCFILCPLSLDRSTSSQLVEEGWAWRWPLPEGVLLFPTVCSDPPLKQKDVRFSSVLMEKKQNKLVVIILDYR